MLYSVLKTLPVSSLILILRYHTMISRYEALLLTVPEITADETKSLESQLDSIVKTNKGSVISFERWGKYRLAYPVRKNDYGVYFLMRFDLNPEGMAALKDIRSLFSVKLHDLVMRDMVTSLDPNQPLTYQRPPSLEDAPTRDVNTFLKENKMEGLMSSEHNHEVEFTEDED